MPMLHNIFVHFPRVLVLFICAAASMARAGDATVDTSAGRIGKDVVATVVSVEVEELSIPTPAGRSLRTLLMPAAPGTAGPVVIVIHDNRGLTSFERGIATEFANYGSTVLVPDLLSETGPAGGGTDAHESAGAAREALADLTAQQIAGDLDAVITAARDRAGADAKIVLAGFGWGAGQAFRYAAERPSLAAVLVFYGPAPNDELLQQLSVPVHGFYGENDVRITGDLSKLKSRLKELGKRFEAVTYAGAGAAFMRSGEIPDSKPADRKGREQALSRVRDILAQL